MSLFSRLMNPGGGAAPRIDGPTARQLVSAGAFLLDVRTPGEFRGGHVPEATNIPVSDLAARLDEVPRDRDVVVYCRSGGRSAKAARILERAGYAAVHDLGPMSAW